MDAFDVVAAGLGLASADQVILVFTAYLNKMKRKSLENTLLILCTPRTCRQTTKSGIEHLPLDMFRILQQQLLFPTI